MTDQNVWDPRGGCYPSPSSLPEAYLAWREPNPMPQFAQPTRAYYSVILNASYLPLCWWRAYPPVIIGQIPIHLRKSFIALAIHEYAGHGTLNWWSPTKLMMRCAASYAYEALSQLMSASPDESLHWRCFENANTLLGQLVFQTAFHEELFATFYGATTLIGQAESFGLSLDEAHEIVASFVAASSAPHFLGRDFSVNYQQIAWVGQHLGMYPIYCAQFYTTDVPDLDLIHGITTPLGLVQLGPQPFASKIRLSQMLSLLTPPQQSLAESRRRSEWSEEQWETFFHDSLPDYASQRERYGTVSLSLEQLLEERRNWWSDNIDVPMNPIHSLALMTTQHVECLVHVPKAQFPMPVNELLLTMDLDDGMIQLDDYIGRENEIMVFSAAEGYVMVTIRPEKPDDTISCVLPMMQDRSEYRDEGNVAIAPIIAAASSWGFDEDNLALRVSKWAATEQRLIASHESLEWFEALRNQVRSADGPLKPQAGLPNPRYRDMEKEVEQLRTALSRYRSIPRDNRQ